MVISNLGQTAPQAVNNFKAAHKGFYNVPAKSILLPGLLIGNMAYKLGTEKNPQKRSEVLWNSVISWLGGTLLYNANSRVLPYFTLPLVAGSLALFKIAQKDTPEEKTDTAVNHGAWWASGIAAQKLAQLANLKGPFNTLCAFAVGASVAGPVIASLIKDKILPLLAKKKDIGNSFNNIRPEYNVGTKQSNNFSPFTEPAAYQINQSGEKTHTNLQNSAYNPFDPFNLEEHVPGGLMQ